MTAHEDMYKAGGAGAGLEDVETVPVRKKRILITGTGSYIGDSVKNILKMHPAHMKLTASVP